jgi:predicted flap endonuclease-1-like 5' DNA nuclease
MNPVFTFVLGLLIGWLIEWVIDYFYWRRRYQERENARQPEPPVAHRSRSTASEVETAQAAAHVRDDLQKIKGIGPVIERKLNEAGIETFEQLGRLTASQLRRILGDAIERLADEESLLQQARDLARRK